MAYIRCIKAGTTQLRIPDPVQIDDDVTASRDFDEMSLARECLPSAYTYLPLGADLHIKHNHLGLLSAFNDKSTLQSEKPEEVSVLKRPNQANTLLVTPRIKIPKLSNQSSPKYSLLTTNDAELNKTTSVSEMATLLKSQGLMTPNKHVRDVPAFKWPPSSSDLVKEGKPCINLSWKPQVTQQFNHVQNPAKQMYNPSRPAVPVLSLEKNSSVQWRHYGIGQLSQTRGTNNFLFTNIASSERFNLGKNIIYPYNRQNFFTSTPKAPRQYKLMQRKPPTPEHIVRNKHAPVFTAVPLISQGSEISILYQEAQKEMNSHGVKVYKSPEELSNKPPGGAVRRISFKPDNETERQSLDDFCLYNKSDFQTGNSVVPIVPGVNIGNVDVREFGRYLENKSVRPRNDMYKFDICDQLKNIKPYVISGWISSTYLLALMQKSNLVNEMFDNALDNVGDVRPEVVKNCRKATPAILARDLVFRLFTLEQLNGINLQKLPRKKMWAIHRCVKKHFPDFNLRCWRKKCIPQIKASLLTLFRHRVKHVQEFWISHNSQPVDLTKDV